MAVIVPDWADTLLDVIGVAWPNVDEDAYRDMADALREFAEDLKDDGWQANQHVQRLLSSGRGEAMDALNGHWGKVKDKHIADIAGAAGIVAGALDTAAGAIEGMKVAALVQLGYLAAEAGIALSLIPVTGGLSLLLGGAAMRATQEVVKRLIKECMEEAVGYLVAALTEPAVAALENMAAELVIQLGANALGVRDGVDLGQVGQSGKEGFREGADGAKDALSLASAGGGTGPGVGPGAGDGVRIDHAEHARAGTKLNLVGVSVLGTTAGKLATAKRHHGRTRGRDSIANVIDPVADKAMDALEKAVKEMGDHLGEKLPQAVRRISKDQKKIDDDIRTRIAGVRDRSGKDDGGSGGGRPPAGRASGGDSARTKPDALRDARPEARRNAIPLEGKTCKGDPVDVAGGEMTLPQTDLSLPGVLPLVLRRTHLSGYRYGQWFGPSWASTLDERLEFDPLGGGAIWAREDGSLLVYPALPHPGGEPVLPLHGPRLPLVHGGQDGEDTAYRVTDPHSGLTRSFTGSPYRTSPAYWLTGISDRNDNHIILTRHPDGTPTTVTHSGGYTAQLSCEDTRVTALALRTPEGRVPLLTYGYDDHGHLTGVTNSSGLPMRFTYDPHGRITSWTDRNNSTFGYVYDPAGRVVRTIGPDGYLSSTFAYEIHGETGQRTTRYTDSTGATSIFQLNDHLQVIAETDPLGNTVHQTWDHYDRLLSRTDALGHTTTWSFDEAGNLTGARLPDGAFSRLVFNELNLLTELTMRDGSVWKQTYDERGNRVSSTFPDGAITRYEYNAAGHLTATMDGQGIRERVHCDAAGLPLAVMGPSGTVTRYERDAFGRPRRITDALGSTTELEWTVEGRIARRIGPEGAEESWSYDGEGNCLSHIDALGGLSRFEYTHFDLLAARTLPDSTRYEFTHDTELRLAEVIDPLGLSWSYEYDRAGRLISETDFDNRTLHYTHDAVGRLASRTNGADETIRFERDGFGRVVTKDVAGAVTYFGYDALGRLSAANGPDAELIFHRDIAGRVLSETCNGRMLKHGYDELGRRIRRTTPAGAESTWKYPAGRRAELDISGHTLTFEFDEAGREISRRIGESIGLEQSWDAHGRLTGQSVIGGDDVLIQRRGYTYRADGQLIASEDALGGSRSFTLDRSGRVTAVSSRSWNERYAYDEAGNQTDASWPDCHPARESTGPRAYRGTRITRAGDVRYEHDAQGRVTLRQKTRLSRRPDTWRYSWDAEDRLTSVTTPDGAVWRYRYDPLGRRIAKQRLAVDGQQVLEQVDFTWDGDTLCEQTTHTADSQMSTSLTWDYDGPKPVAQTERKISADASQREIDRRFFAIITDLVGTPRELIDETGHIAWRTRTTLWGATTWSRTATAYTPLRFPGQYFDPESGLHYNRFRHYDPETARYLSPDPLGLVASPNTVTYVHNPTTLIDPLGLAPCLSPHADHGHRHSVVLGVNDERQQSNRLAEHLRNNGDPGAHTYNGKPFDQIDAGAPLWMTNVINAVRDRDTSLSVTLDGMPNREGVLGNWNTPESIAEAFQVAVQRGEGWGLGNGQDPPPSGNGTAWEMSVIARNVKLFNADPDLGGRSWDSIDWYSGNKRIENVVQPNIPELDPFHRKGGG
ncbi:RHS repeat-associated core domain-containing protein [Streptomyces sp. NPDC088554]|uniref:RHS repeat-associated core domain-containing protein n=1 Tax=Streptomyces sp. NPDC088554 TaxID=3365865 RepID=UPI0038180E4B